VDRGTADSGGAPPESARVRKREGLIRILEGRTKQIENQRLDDPSLTRRVTSSLSSLRALPRACLLAIETAGLTNSPVFLVGCARVEKGALILRQFVAVDYAAERLLLDCMAQEIAGSIALTFNGGAFDLPVLLQRAISCRANWTRPYHHVDLLPLARRHWRGTVPNCRLTTLERWVLGKRRSKEIVSRDVPALFHRFVRSGQSADLAPILRHNQENLVSMCGLAIALDIL
jgi:uncharacterized protein YprB with RNaseH-like and TPR domain